MEEVKYLIIGGGISGLSFAKYVKDDYKIIEKENEAGGLCRTHYVGDYVWDYAGHFFHFADPNIKAFFEEHLQEDAVIQCEKNTKVLYSDSYIDYPFQKNIHQLSKEDFIECLYDLYFREEKENYNDFLDMLYGKFGKGITEKFLKPYNEKLYACNLNELDTNSMGRFFPYADTDEIIRNMHVSNNSSYNGHFDYPARGAQTIINILSSEIDSSRVELNTEVSWIDVEEKRACIGKKEIQYEYLINTIPFNHFVELYNTDFDKKSLSANKVLVFNIGFNRKMNVPDLHWVYIPSKEYIFYRIGFYDNILSKDKGSMYVEIGYPESAKLTEDVVNAAYERTIEDLKKCHVLTDQQIVAHEALVIDPGYVHITSEGIDKIARERKLLEEKGIYCIGRYGQWTYCSMEDCILQAKDLAERIK